MKSAPLPSITLRGLAVLLAFCAILSSGVSRAGDRGDVAGSAAPPATGQNDAAKAGSQAPRLAAQSVVIESEGYACMGDDKSRHQTEIASLQNAKRNATESATSYIKSETSVKDGMLEKDLVSAYANAQVRVIQEMMKEWYKDATVGDCYRVKVKAEVVPDEKAMASLSAKGGGTLEADPSAPLNVKVWTDRPSYAEGECVRLYLKGNKPFYGRLVYQQADGNLVQLLPNPFRQANHFEGGTVYELPSAEDRFKMDTCAPFGAERVTLYASTSPGGDPEVEAADKVYLVKTKAADMAMTTRGIKLSASSGPQKPALAEFAEAVAHIRSGAK